MSEFSSLNGYKIKDEKAIRSYDTVLDMVADINLKRGNTCSTLGKLNKEDGLQEFYYIRERLQDDTYTDGTLYLLNNNLVAEKILKKEIIYFSKLYSDDYDSAFTKLVNLVNSNDYSIVYLDVNSNITISDSYAFTKPVIFYGMNNKILKTTKMLSLKFMGGNSKIYDIRTDGVSILFKPQNVYFNNCHVENAVSVEDSVDELRYCYGFAGIVENDTDYKNIMFENCSCKNFGSQGFSFRDTSSNGDKAKSIENVIYKNCIADTSRGTYSNGFTIQATEKVKNVIYENCIACNNAESGFHCEAFEDKSNVTFINCEAYGNGLTEYKDNPTYGYGFLCYKNFTLINCHSHDNLRNYSVHPTVLTVNKIEFANFIECKSDDGELFSYSKNKFDINNWLDSKMPLGVNGYIYPDYTGDYYFGYSILYNKLQFTKDSSGNMILSPKNFVYGDNLKATTPPIRIDPDKSYEFSFEFKVDNPITYSSVDRRDNLQFWIVTLDKNFKKNNGTNKYLLTIWEGSTTYSKRSVKIGNNILSSSLTFPQDTAYIVIGVNVCDASMIGSGFTPVVGEPLDTMQNFSVKNLELKENDDTYLKSPNNTIYKLNVANDGTLSTTSV